MSEEIEVPDSWKNFQSYVITEKEWPEKILDDLLLFKPEDPKTIHTIYRALKNKTLNADSLMLVAGIMCVRGDQRFLPHFGLALQHGANPNLYAEFPSPEEGNPPILIHVAILFWMRTAFSRKETLDAFYLQGKAVEDDIDEDEIAELQEESKRLILIVTAMLCLAGSDFDNGVTTPALLLEQGYNPTNFSLYYPYYLDSVRNFMTLSFVPGREYWLKNRERFQLYYENNKDASLIYRSRFINDNSKKNLFLMALFLDHYPILSLPEVYESPEILGMLFKFQARKTLLQLFSRWEKNQIILIEPASVKRDGPAPEEEQVSRIRELDLMELSLDYFNQDFFYRLLDYGIQAHVFPANYLTKIVLNSRYYSLLYPVQSQVLNSMLIKIATYGGVFNLDHLVLIKSFSVSTFDAIKKAMDVPVWKNVCRSMQSDDAFSLNPDIVEIARQLNLPIGSRPKELCDQMNTLHQVGKKVLLKQLWARQRKIIESKTSKIKIIRAGAEDNQEKLRNELFKDQTLSVDEIQAFTLRTAIQKTEDDRMDVAAMGKIFGNQDSLERPVEDYPEIDRVIYMSDNQYWIFTSNNYEDLLKRGRNPWVNTNADLYGEEIPEQVMLEIERKLALLKAYDLNLEAGSIEYGVSALFASSPERTQEFNRRIVTRRNNEFFRLLKEYEIDSSAFDDFTSDDFDEMGEELLHPSLRIVTIDKAFRLAMDDFIDAAKWQVAIFSDLDTFMENLKAYLNGKKSEEE